MGFFDNIERDLKNLTKWLVGDKKESKKKSAVKSKPKKIVKKRKTKK